jgi:hypothetical protein
MFGPKLVIEDDALPGPERLPRRAYAQVWRLPGFQKEDASRRDSSRWRVARATPYIFVSSGV